ncbi:hypothetical protein Ddc_00507 [Ditylenchus destructor]|nr:hypothetical protein Ddc_00507 [Ditylenchus destructor]
MKRSVAVDEAARRSATFLPCCIIIGKERQATPLHHSYLPFILLRWKRHHSYSTASWTDKQNNVLKEVDGAGYEL